MIDLRPAWVVADRGVERLSYNQARDAGYTEDQALAVGRWNDPALADAAAACRVENSFSGGTFVALTDGSMLPIADIQVGDQVLAYDFDTGETVARAVTATLPHEDWLLQAHLSDGSVMSVTEDHRFWSVTDTAWVELQDLDTTDQLLTPDGAAVTVDYLDWDAGADAPAWDLTAWDSREWFPERDDEAVAESWERLARLFDEANRSKVRRVVLTRSDQLYVVPSEWKGDTRAYIQSAVLALSLDASDEELGAAIRRAMELTTS